MDKRACWATVYRVAESDMTKQLTHTYTHTHMQKLSSFVPVTELKVKSKY